MMDDSRSYFSKAVSYAHNLFYKIKQRHQCCQTYFSLSLEINQLQLEQGNLTEVEGSVQLTSLYKLVQISSFLIEIIQLCYKISYLILDVNCTELSSSVNVPWLESLEGLSTSFDKHSSLFCQSKADKENSFYQTFFLCHLYIRQISKTVHPWKDIQPQDSSCLSKVSITKKKSFLSNIFLFHLLIELISQCIDQRDCS